MERIYNKKDYFDKKQCDSLEFLEYLIQNTHPNIRSIFNFKIKTNRQYLLNGELSGCQFCGQYPQTLVENDVVLKLAFPEKKYDGVPLQQLINERFSGKFTEQEHGMRCSNCCKHGNTLSHDPRKCKQKPFLSEDKLIDYPKYLIAQLIRFKQTGADWEKLDLLVSDSEEIIIDDTGYELVSVINHEGTFERGHYTALIKSSNWYNCDDITNKIIGDSSIIDAKNYVYVFRKKESLPNLNTNSFVPTKIPKILENENEDLPKKKQGIYQT